MIDPDPPAEFTPQVRSAKAVLYILLHGRALTWEIARLTGLSWDGAYRMMCALSVDPELGLYQDDHAWVLLNPRKFVKL